MGPSGSGKSTLLHLAAGLDRPDSGRVIVAGHDLGALGEGALTRFRRREVGIVFQQFNLIATLTAAQNVALPAIVDRRPRFPRFPHSTWRSRKWIDWRVAELLDRLGLADRADHRPDALSGGEQQRVAIARALMLDPKVLLADEPTGNLDSQSSQRLWQQLEELAEQQQITVLMVTHEPAAVVHCRHVYVLVDGKMKGDFAVEGLDTTDVASRYQQLGR